MDIDILPALVLFAFVSSITPGPNNLMLMASGANFGLRRTLPHMLGVSLGFVFLMIVVGNGLAQVFERWPVSLIGLKVLSVVYLLWLAAKIAGLGPVHARESAARPLTFLQAAAFQWVNPKAWAMALTVISVYLPDTSPISVLLAGCIFGAVNLPSVGTWTLMGKQLARWLTNPRRLTVFNRVMAGLLVASLYPVLFNAG